MSGLAQLLRDAECAVSGSDRALANPENRDLFSALRQQGIKLFPQDGSFIEYARPDFLIYSTAIEEDNPDFTADEEIPRVHRAEALATAIQAVKGQPALAITGSCGKTTVSAWLGETLEHLQLDPTILCGGRINRFSSDQQVGNYRSGKGSCFVFEADESDKSLLAFEPDYGVLLNIGTDHYSRDELIETFLTFIAKIKRGLVIEYQAWQAMGQDALKNLEITVISDQARADLPENSFYLKEYTSCPEQQRCIISSEKQDYSLSLPVPGLHSALNAMAVLAAIDMLGQDLDAALPAISRFSGVWRRFDFVGNLANGCPVYDDYAHNVEKIIACLKTAREINSGKLIALFQPHGFGPLAFMREKLFPELEKNLDDQDRFIMLPVYYAGGSSSFTPSSEEVIRQYQQEGQKNYLAVPDRNAAIKEIAGSALPGDVVIVMGARDNSLSLWAREIGDLKLETES